MFSQCLSRNLIEIFTSSPNDCKWLISSLNWACLHCSGIIVHFFILGKQVSTSMYYGSGTVDRIATRQSMDAAAYAAVGSMQTLHMHSPGGSTFLHEMTSWPPPWKFDVKSKIWLRRSMHIYLKNNPAKLHFDPIWNDGAFGCFEESRPNKMSSDMRIIPDQKSLVCVTTRLSGTRWQMNLEIRIDSIALIGSLKQFSLAITSVTSTLEVFSTKMRYSI